MWASKSHLKLQRLGKTSPDPLKSSQPKAHQNKNAWGLSLQQILWCSLLKSSAPHLPVGFFSLSRQGKPKCSSSHLSCLALCSEHWLFYYFLISLIIKGDKKVGFKIGLPTEGQADLKTYNWQWFLLGAVQGILPWVGNKLSHHSLETHQGGDPVGCFSSKEHIPPLPCHESDRETHAVTTQHIRDS